MPEETPKIIADSFKIRIPSHWTPPKYHFGQWVKQGIIVGCDYYPRDRAAAYQYKEAWRYSVLPDFYADAESIETYQESEIKPFSPEELRAALEADIAFHELRLTELKKYCNQVSSHD